MACHLTKEERDLLAQLLHRRFSQEQIAEALGRNPGTISRELARNRVGSEYFAAQAQELAERRRRERPRQQKLDDYALNDALRCRLAPHSAAFEITSRQALAQSKESRRQTSARNL